MPQEDEDIIILSDEITPPVDGSKKDKFLGSITLKKTTESGTWKAENYIVGKRTPEDKQYCEPVSQLDLHSTSEIRTYITAVEKFLTEKEAKRSVNESQGRILKYILCFGLGVSVVLWAIWAGAILIPNL
jgi:hypothetical protein